MCSRRIWNSETNLFVRAQNYPSKVKFVGRRPAANIHRIELSVPLLPDPVLRPAPGRRSEPGQIRTPRSITMQLDLLTTSLRWRNRRAARKQNQPHTRGFAPDTPIGAGTPR